MVTTVTKQTLTCLTLYRTYAGIKHTTCTGDYHNVEECRAKMYTMECQIPPYELRPFQLLWDSRAHRRCTECNIQLMDDWEGARCKTHKVVPTTVQYTCKALLDEDSPPNVRRSSDHREGVRLLSEVRLWQRTTRNHRGP